jgi:outer membrane protein insertion porin family
LSCRSNGLAGDQNLWDGGSFEFLVQGNDSVSRQVLRELAAPELSDFRERGCPRSAADDAAYALETYYRAQGFASARVSYEILRPDEALPRLTLKVNEGPRCQISEISFQGATVFAHKDLALLMGGPTTAILGLGKVYFVRAEADSARSALETLYLERGFADIQVSEPSFEFNADKTRVALHFAVDEGSEYLLGEVRFEGLSGAELMAAQKSCQELLGRPYFARLGFEARSRLASLYTNRGYADAEITLEEVREEQGARVILKLNLQRGPRVRITAIEVLGNERTRATFIRQRIEMQPGDYYNRSLERQAFGELYSSGLFERVDISLAGTGTRRVLRVSVVEAATLKFSVEAGFGAFERARVLFGISEGNIAGTGRSLTLEGKLAQRAESLRLFLSDPWTLGRRHELGLASFYDQRQEPAFESVELGGNISISRRESRHLRTILGFEYRLSDAQSVEVDLSTPEIDAGQKSYIAALYLTSKYDSRDSVFLPTRGTWARLHFEVAPRQLGSELQFSRLEGRIAAYHPLGEHAVLAWTLQGGLIVPMQSSSEIPLQERYFNGGQNSVRSFGMSELGPQDTGGHPIGGEAYSVASLELRQKLPGNFTGALFVDAGHVAAEAGSALEFRNMGFAYGPGLRWLLPIGPLRLDWGINPDPKGNEADWVLQFSVGVAF